MDSEKIKPMKMLIAYLYCNKGGVTSVIKQRMSILLQHRWQVDAVFKLDHQGTDDLLKEGVHEVKIFPRNFEQEIKKLLDQGGYDLLVVFDTPELITKSNIHPNTKIIYEIHTPILDTIKKNSTNNLASCDAIFVPSNWSKNTLSRLYPNLDPNSISVIPNIVNQNYFTLEGEIFNLSAPTLIWVGKFADYKNWDEAIRVAAVFLETHSEWQFMAVTGGNFSNNDVVELLSQFSSQTLPRVNWIHNLSQNEMGKLYRAAARSNGFLLSTSKAESFCLVIHEAMRCGLPVVSSDIGAIPEIISDQVNGFLYPLGDLKTCLEKCDLLTDPETRAKIIPLSLESLQAYNQDVLEQKYINAIRHAFG